MFGFFKTKPILSKRALDFEIASFCWLLDNFGIKEFYNETQLIVPNEQFFPIKMSDSRDVAEETFEYVKEYTGMSDWSCTLEEQEPDIDPFVSNNTMVKNLDAAPLGTFFQDESYRVIITYNPSIVKHPMNLIATFVHELSHYRIRDTGAMPPGGWDNEEYLTDIASTFLGFGIFMANSTFNTYNDADWWQASRSGYLSETEHIYALGIFLELKKISFDDASKFLKPHLKKLLKKVLKEIRRDKILERILDKEPENDKSEEYNRWRN